MEQNPTLKLIFKTKKKQSKHNSKAGLEALHVKKNISVEICFKMLILGEEEGPYARSGSSSYACTFPAR